MHLTQVDPWGLKTGKTLASPAVAFQGSSLIGDLQKSTFRQLSVFGRLKTCQSTRGPSHHAFIAFANNQGPVFGNPGFGIRAVSVWKRARGE